jgi:thioredoxin-like negative regulator of GroEL
MEQGSDRWWLNKYDKWDNAGVHRVSNDKELAKASSGKTSAIVFYAPWCPHCQHAADRITHLGAAVEDYNERVGDRMSVSCVDGDANPNMAKKFGVRAFPTVIFMKNGKVDEYNGNREPEEMMRAMEYYDHHGKMIPISREDY